MQRGRKRYSHVGGQWSKGGRINGSRGPVSIVEDDLDVTFGVAAGEVQEFPIELHAKLVSCTNGYYILAGPPMPWGDSMEAIRVVMRRCEAMTSGAARANVKAPLHESSSQARR